MPAARGRAVHRREGLEQAALRVGREADAGVLVAGDEAAGVVVARGQARSAHGLEPQALLLGGELRRVGHAVISRAAQQMNIFAIGFPVTVSAGLPGIRRTPPMMQAPFTMALERMVALLAR